MVRLFFTDEIFLGITVRFNNTEYIQSICEGDNVASGGIRSAADVVKVIALGADAVAIGTAALVARGWHMCQNVTQASVHGVLQPKIRVSDQSLVITSEPGCMAYGVQWRKARSVKTLIFKNWMNRIE
jgi:imidazole glycerol phosphate synthase subunit HisF